MLGTRLSRRFCGGPSEVKTLDRPICLPHIGCLMLALSLALRKPSNSHPYLPLETPKPSTAPPKKVRGRNPQSSHTTRSPCLGAFLNGQ